jgi:pectate lyase
MQWRTGVDPVWLANITIRDFGASTNDNGDDSMALGAGGQPDNHEKITISRLRVENCSKGILQGGNDNPTPPTTKATIFGSYIDVYGRAPTTKRGAQADFFNNHVLWNDEGCFAEDSGVIKARNNVIDGANAQDAAHLANGMRTRNLGGTEGIIEDDGNLFVNGAGSGGSGISTNTAPLSFTPVDNSLVLAANAVVADVAANSGAANANPSLQI